MSVRIGIDFGGTKLEALALAVDGSELARERVATPRGDYVATLETIKKLVTAMERRYGPCTVGLGTPGAVALDGRMKNCNSTWLNGRLLPADLQQYLGRPVRIANDADCLALSEATDGAAAGAPIVFAAILGTGVGGAICVGGELLVGANRIAGEWGHNPLPWPQPSELPGSSCYCGLHGCIETWLSGPALAEDHRRHGGARVTAAEIGELARNGDVVAQASVERYCERLGRALASVINLLDPGVIVLGGGLSNMDLLYDEVPARWRRYVFSDVVQTRLLRARHGDSSGVRGAARLWPA